MDETDGIVGEETAWKKTFALFPHKTISNKWIWLDTVYSRRAWYYTGFCDEPYTQYATIFDILAINETQD